MIIGLLGFEFQSSNKGCEALSYTVMPILAKLGKGLTVIVFNIHESLGEIPPLYPDIHFENVPIHMKSPQFWLDFIYDIKRCDYILDITHGDSFSDIYGQRWFDKTCLLKELANAINGKLILMPQTYGPFLSERSLQKAKKIINKSYAVFSRDETSTAFLRNELNCNRQIITTCDLAFMLPYKAVTFDHSKINIGLNISGLLWNLGNENNPNRITLEVNYQSFCRQLIEYLHNEGKYQIHLVPHVLCDEREGSDFFDNDCSAIRQLLKEYSFCIYAGDFSTVCDVKNYIAGLDILIAARMHASIGAFSAGICSIPFAYSRKFEGVYNDLHYPYLIDGEHMTTAAALDKAKEYIRNFEDISSSAKAEICKMKLKHDFFLNKLLECMGVSR